MRRLALLLFGFSISVNVLSAEGHSSALASGDWQLDRTSVGQPGVLFIREYRVTFAKDGTWHYAARMGGRFDGMELIGSGKWKSDGHVLEYTAGENKGMSRIQIDSSTLILSPDPVLVFNGSKKIDTYYRHVP